MLLTCQGHWKEVKLCVSVCVAGRVGERGVGGGGRASQALIVQCAASDLGLAARPAYRSIFLVILDKKDLEKDSFTGTPNL